MRKLCVLCCIKFRAVYLGARDVLRIPDAFVVLGIEEVIPLLALRPNAHPPLRQLDLWWHFLVREIGWLLLCTG